MLCSTESFVQRVAVYLLYRGHGREAAGPVIQSVDRARLVFFRVVRCGVGTVTRRTVLDLIVGSNYWACGIIIHVCLGLSDMA